MKSKVANLLFARARGQAGGRPVKQSGVLTWMEGPGSPRDGHQVAGICMQWKEVEACSF